MRKKNMIRREDDNEEELRAALQRGRDTMLARVLFRAASTRLASSRRQLKLDPSEIVVVGVHRSVGGGVLVLERVVRDADLRACELRSREKVVA